MDLDLVEQREHWRVAPALSEAGCIPSSYNERILTDQPHMITFARPTLPCVADPSVSANAIGECLDVTKDSNHGWIGNPAMPAHRVGGLRRSNISEVGARVRGGGDAEATGQGAER